MLAVIKNRNMQSIVVFLFLYALGWVMSAFVDPDQGLLGITGVGFQVLAIFLGFAYSWSRTNEIWPSLLCLFLLPFTQVALFTSFTDLLVKYQIIETAFFLIMLFVFLRFLEEREVGQFLAGWLLGRKFLRRRPWVFLFIFFFAAFAISSLINIFVGIYLMWGIGTSISRMIGFKPYEKFPTLIALGVSIMGALGLSVLPWGNNSMVMLTILSGPNYLTLTPSGTETMMSPDLLRYMMFTIPVGILSIFVVLFLYKFFFRLDVKRLKRMGPDFINPEDAKLTTPKAIGLLSLVVFIILMLLPEFWSNIFTAPSFIQSIGFMDKIGKIIILLIILSIIRVKRQPIFNFNQLAARGIGWNVVGLYLAAIPLGLCLLDPSTGFYDFFSTYMTPVFQEWPTLAVLAVFAFAAVILTNFISNVHVCLFLMPMAFIVLQGHQIWGKAIPLEMIAALLIMVCSFGWITPASSPAGMVMYANKDWLKPKEIVIYSVPILLVMTLVALLYSYFVMPWLYPAL